MMLCYIIYPLAVEDGRVEKNREIPVQFKKAYRGGVLRFRVFGQVH